MALSKITAKSDRLGMFASGLCLLHCLMAPVIFMWYFNMGAAEETYPFWWSILDVVFLALSFLAVYWSARNTSKTWIKYALGITWALLCILVLNEKFELLPLFEEAIYGPTVSLILLHFYNRRHCDCKSESCCNDQ